MEEIIPSYSIVAYSVIVEVEGTNLGLWVGSLETRVGITLDWLDYSLVTVEVEIDPFS